MFDGLFGIMFKISEENGREFPPDFKRFSETDIRLRYSIIFSCRDNKRMLD